MGQLRHLMRQDALGLAFFWSCSRLFLERVYDGLIEKGETFQIGHRFTVVGIQPELIKLEWRRPLRIEPDRTGFGLAELRPRRGLHQRPHQPMSLFATQLADEIDASGDVA